MVVGDPALVVGLAGARGGSDGLGTREGGVGVRRLLGLLAGGGLVGALSLWEQGLDPGLVDEVESTGEGAGQDKVQEDAIQPLAYVFMPNVLIASCQVSSKESAGRTSEDRRSW